VVLLFLGKGKSILKKKELEKRHQAEKEFHNIKYSQKKKETIYGIGFTSIIFDDMLAKLGDISGKKVVDFGCGNGWLSKILLKKHAEVYAFDISEEAVKKTTQVAEKAGFLDMLHTDVMPAERLLYKDNTFDVVVGSAILHHLDLKIATKEISRVLKTGGVAYFMEPLGHNPLINMYRKRTPDIRSLDESPLYYKDFNIVKVHFSVFVHHEYYLITLLSLFWFYLFKNKKMTLISRNFLYKIDHLFLKLFPFFKKYCWYSILIMKK
jgi:ubiquinone/menaquinone biosynthesis C-methylase UbiE